MKNNNLTQLFLAESDKANWEAYLLSLKGEPDCIWDFISITVTGAADEADARSALNCRKHNGFLPLCTDFCVYRDTEGQKLGSGGAMLNVIRDLASKKVLSGRKSLIINAGGADGSVSRLFRPLPRLLPDGRFSTLFDEQMILAAALVSRLSEGTVVLSGNTLSIFNPLQIEFPASGAACLSVLEPVGKARNRGVYEETGGVLRLHHNLPDSELATKANSYGHVQVDTGIVWFGCDVLNELSHTGEKYIHLYRDICAPLASRQKMRLIPLYPAYYADFSEIGADASSECLGFGAVLACHSSLTLSEANDWENDYRINRFAGEALSGNPDAAIWLGPDSRRELRVNMILDQLRAGKWNKYPDAMRLYAFLSDEPKNSEYCIQNCFSILRDKSVNTLEIVPVTEFKKLQSDISLPIRANWSGVWSDAPPYCYEEGGTFLNAALTLDGNYPISVTAKSINTPEIILESVDLGIKASFRDDIAGLLACDNTSDAFALHKAALRIAGIISPDMTEASLRKMLNTTGGLQLTSKVGLPRGSGLGGSSILAGGLIRALEEITGVNSDTDILIDKVLTLEQMVTSGGGWQDQIGGLIPGIKLISTQPGIPQNFNIDIVKISSEIKNALNCRMFLLYTGQRRLARRILRKVMLRYLKSERDILSAIDESRRNAVIMKYELENGRLREFAELISRNTELARITDPSSTNVWIDHIFEGCRPYADAVTICGAGGGGFAFGILKDGAELEAFQRHLDMIYQGIGVRVYPCGLAL